MKVTRKLLMVSVEVPVKVGGLECIAEYQVCRDLGSRDEVDDIDFIDITDISYLGVPIKGYDNWNKFKKFHMEYGIDWNQAIEGAALKQKQDIIDLVNESY
jgi:hypothetical protein